MSVFQPPPTYAMPVLINEKTKESEFNPIWLKWFLDLTEGLSSSGAGSVSSVAMSVPTEFLVAGSPITTTGTLAVTKATQTANTAWAGPTTGAAAQPAFRALVAADLPATAVTSTAVLTDNAITRGDGGVRGIQTSTAFIDDSGRLLINNATSVAGSTGLTAPLQVNSIASGTHAIGLGGWSADNAGAYLNLVKSRGAAVGTHTIVQSGDSLGGLIWAGANGTVFRDAAYMWTFVDGTPGAGTDMPGRIVFSTSPDGTATPAEVLRLDSSQRVTLGGAATNQASAGSPQIAQLSVHGTSATLTSNNGFFGMGNWSNNATGPQQTFSKSRGATVGSYTIVQSGDTVGGIVSSAADGVDMAFCTHISFVVDGTPGSGDMPGRIAFHTSQDGTENLTESYRVDSGQRIVMGGIASVTVGNAGRLQVNGTTVATSQAQVSGFAADATTAGSIVLSKSRHATVGSNTIVQSGDLLGQIVAYGADGTNYDPAAQIVFEVDGTPGAGTDMPGRIRLLTSPDGTATLTEVLRVNNQQELLVGVTTRNTSGGKLQIKAGGQTTNNSNVGGTTYYNVIQTGNGALTETDAFSHSVAAATLATNGDTLEFEASGTITASASVDKRIKVIFGSTTLFDTGALAITGATDWTLFGTIIRTGAATQKAKVSMNTSAAALMAYCDYTAPTETLANALTLRLTINATLANDVIAEFYKEKWMPGA